VDYAVQIAHGLAAAHEAGIVHRDLKPENVFVTKDERVKILDFGLAKLRPTRDLDDLSTEAATESEITGTGVVLGTAGYMSPEQVEGKLADHRSDIFSFGSVLFEMLSGRRAFRRDSSIETMRAILKEDPGELAETKANVPPALERVVRRCLEKRPEERFQSARDLAFALEAFSAPSATGSKPLPAPGGSRRVVVLALAVVVLIAGVAVAAFLAGQGRAEKTPPSYHRLTFRRGTIWGARFARDGQTIVYGAAWEGQPVKLFATRAESPESRALDLPDADILAISSRDEMAILLSRDYSSLRAQSAGTLARVPLAGGAPRPVLEGVYDADWSPDGSDLAVVRSAGQAWQTWPVKQRLEFPIGKVLFETDGGTIAWPRVSPRGDPVAFLSPEGISVVDRAGEMRTLAPATWCMGLTWSPTGDEVWYTEVGPSPALLQAVTLAGRRRLLDHFSGATTLGDVSRDGRALLTLGTWNLGLAGRRAGETRERDLSWFDGSRMINMSADGELLLFTEQGDGVGGSPVAYLRKTDGSSPPVRLGEGFATRLSSDGNWVLVNRDTPGQLVLLSTGSGQPKILDIGKIEHNWSTFSGDGKQVVLIGCEPGRPNRSWILEIAGGPPRSVTPEGVIGMPAPDKQSLLASDADRRLSLYPVGGGEPRPVPGPPEPGMGSAWAADGHSIFVTERRGPAALVFRRDLTTGRREPWATIEPADPAGVLLVNPDLTADGKSYVYSYARHLSSLYLIEGLK
jgi:hypothetical protein